MQGISYGVFTIFIAFILFSVIKNMFFNSNQLSKTIRHRYLYIVIAYFAMYSIGIAAIVLSDKTVTYIILDIVFLLMSLPMVFTSIRMDSNDTSAYNKWYYSQKDPGEYLGDSKETKSMYIFYFMIMIFFAAPLGMMYPFCDGSVESLGCIYTFIPAAFAFSVMVIFINITSLGELIRKNLLYNYLWDKKQKEASTCNKKIINEKLEKLFRHLFVNKKYSDNSPMNEQILEWIKK